MLFNRLVGRLNEKITTATRQGKDIDAIAEVDLLIANVNEEFDEAFNAMQKEVASMYSSHTSFTLMQTCPHCKVV